MNKEDFEKIKDIIESQDWVCYSCGRSTDYYDEVDVDESIKDLLEEIKKLTDTLK